MMGFDVPSLALLGQDLCGPHVAVLASLLGSTAAAACAAGWTARGYSSSSERSVTDDPVSAGLESSSDSPSPASWAKQGVNKEQQKRGKAWPLFLQRKPLKDDSKHREAQYVYRVCLTGGPCGGKSSSQESLSKVLTAKGYDVYFAPEVPTILMNGGCVYPGSSPEKKAQLTAFEDGIIQMQMQMERSFTSIAASTGRASVVIFDRGLLDIPAYLPRQAWLELLNGLGFTEEYFAQRYDIVLHLVTTAHGVEEIYDVQKANNTARQETAAQARELCDKVLQCWAIHPNVLRLENTDAGFADKLEKGTRAVLDMIDAKKIWLQKKAAAQS